MGPCAKRQVEARLYPLGGDKIFVGRNDCEHPQPVCPRAPDEDYEKCTTVCGQSGHAEIEALRAAGDTNLKGATLALTGHWRVCRECAEAIRDAGINTIWIKVAP